MTCSSTIPIYHKQFMNEEHLTHQLAGECWRIDTVIARLDNLYRLGFNVIRDWLSG